MPEPTWLSGWKALLKPIGAERRSEPSMARVTEQTVLQHGPSAAVGVVVGGAAVVMIRHVRRLFGMDVDDAVAVFVRLGLVRMGRHGRAIRQADLVGVEARHGRPVQHERGHRDEHDARDETT